MAEEIERIYVIPLKKTKFKASRAAPTAIKRVRKYLTHHMKVEAEKIWIDDSLNKELWSHGKYKMPSKIRVKAVKFEDGVVEVYLPELEFKKSRRELLREERESKEPILHKEEMEPEEDEGEASGTEDYETVPTADGDVKLKKKKTHKEKEEKTEKKETKKAEKKPVAKHVSKKTTTKKPEIKKKTPKTEKKPKTTKKATTAKKPAAKKETKK